MHTCSQNDAKIDDRIDGFKLFSKKKKGRETILNPTDFEVLGVPKA